MSDLEPSFQSWIEEYSTNPNPFPWSLLCIGQAMSEDDEEIATLGHVQTFLIDHDIGAPKFFAYMNDYSVKVAGAYY